MHYVPDSARELLPDGGNASAGPDAPDFHLRSAPLYALTIGVGLLLGADLLTDLVGGNLWGLPRSLFGFRLALLAAVLGGSRILYGTLENLFAGRIGADLALTIACLAAILLGEHVTAALVVFIALCGESVEGYTVDRARAAIRGAFALAPPVAHLLDDSGTERDVPLAEVVPGARIVVRPGERVPVDGRVATGRSSLDESIVTGESRPIDKGPGDRLLAGTTNQFGALVVQVERVGRDTLVARVQQLVSEAAAQKSPVERTADRLARWFLPCVLAAAFLTWVGWRIAAGDWQAGARPALGVLVVACPCALVLATPTAVMASLAWLARAGIVVKGSRALESLAAIDTFAFDKTGTLTRGEPVLETLHVLAGSTSRAGSHPLDESDLLRTAAVAERLSEHPYARLLVRAAESRGLVVPAPEEFEARPGGGVIATVRATQLGPWAFAPDDPAPHETRRRVVVGHPAWVASLGVASGEAIAEAVRSAEAAGRTVLVVAVDDEALGVLGVTDALRPESRGVLDELRTAGVARCVLLSGDRPAVVSDVAQTLGLDESHGGLYPQDKAKWVVERTGTGRPVVFVGDGTNDAPALAAATVGIALGSAGSDLAATAGDIVFLGDPLRPLPGLVRLSRALVRNIRQGILLFAFGANALGMLLCGVGWLSPAWGAVFHECASLAVMLNALRLLWFERSRTAEGPGWSARLATFADRVADFLSPSRWVYLVLEHRGRFALGGAALVVAGWLVSNVLLVTEGEQALAVRYGRLEAVLHPGWHWRWPTPFERIVRERTDLVRRMELGFRRRTANGTEAASTTAVRGATDGLAPTVVEWTSEHGATGDESVLEEALILTGDEVPVELTAEIPYRIADLPQYAFGTADPRAVLRATVEAGLRRVCARSSLEAILVQRRRETELACLAFVRERLAEYGTGLEVQDVLLLDVHPPRAVVPAYRDVADALEQRQQQIEEAEAYYASKLLTAVGEEAVRTLARFESGAGERPGARRTSTGEVGRVATWTLDEAKWRELATGRSGESPLLSGRAAVVLDEARAAAARRTESAKGEAARFQALLEVSRAAPEATRTRLYWETVSEVLSSRPLTLVDPRVAGRQHLLLLDPSDLREAPLPRPALPPFDAPPASEEPALPATESGTATPARKTHREEEGG